MGSVNKQKTIYVYPDWETEVYKWYEDLIAVKTVSLITREDALKLYWEKMIKSNSFPRVNGEPQNELEEETTCTRCSNLVEDWHDDDMLGGVICEDCFEELYE